MHEKIHNNQIKQENLYIFLLIACLAGYIWLFYNLKSAAPGETVGVCLFKNVTGVPCPSCGSSRSTLEILSGNLKNALIINPFGYIILSGLIILPLWIGSDIILRTNTFYRFYLKTENYLKIPSIAVIIIILVIGNWFWNITKGL